MMMSIALPYLQVKRLLSLLIPLILFLGLPSTVSSDLCEDLCKENRRPLIDADNAYEFECAKNTFYPRQSDLNKTVEEICAMACSKCNKICNDEDNEYLFSCPAISPVNSTKKAHHDQITIIISIVLICIIVVLCIGGAIFAFYIGRKRQRVHVPEQTGESSGEIGHAPNYEYDEGGQGLVPAKRQSH